MKENNALVTYSDLTTMGLTTKSAPPTGNQIATKSFINTYYYVDQSFLSSYTNNQCVIYQDIQGSNYNSSTIYYVAYPDLYTGFDTRGEACSHTSGLTKTVYWFGTLGVGTNLYYDEGGYNGNSFTGYYPNASLYGGPYFYMDGKTFQLGGSPYSGCTTCGVQDIEVGCQYRIDWDFTTDATSGDLQILVNGIQVVYTTTNSSNFFLVNPGDYVQANTTATATFPLAVDAYLYVYDSVDGVLYNVTNGGGSFAANTYGPYTPSGDGQISANAHEY